MGGKKKRRSKAPRVDPANPDAPIMLENFWGKKERYYTAEQVARHNKPTDCWLIINNKVYDVTHVIPHHPGGSQSILNNGGRDASFHVQFHSSAMTKMLDKLYLGNLLKSRDDEKCIIL